MMETADDLAKIKNAEAPERAARAKRYAEKNRSFAPATTGPMTKAEAEAITARIVTSAENLGELLLTAQRREAWKAMGFDSWREYATAKFKFSERHLYRLLDHAAVIENICPIGQNGNSPKGENSPNGEKPTEGVTRPLAKLPPRHQQDAWKTAVESSSNGKPTAEAVKTAVARVTGRSSRFPAAEKHPLLRSMKQMWRRMPVEAQEQFRKWIEDGTA